MCLAILGVRTVIGVSVYVTVFVCLDGFACLFDLWVVALIFVCDF